MEPVAVIPRVLRENMDLLNQPEALGRLLQDMSLLLASVFVVVGALCVLNGFRWHKPVILIVAALLGAWIGWNVYPDEGTRHIVSVCVAALTAMLSFPLLRYSTALLGALAGAFAGANIWTAIGQPQEQHQIGAVIGLIIVGMLAFLAFRAVVVIFTTVTGATMLTLGAASAMLEVPSWEEGVLRNLQEHPHIMPIIVGSLAGIGAVLQVGGGLTGINAMANKADPTRAKPKPA